jgi:hypothetical protein
MGRGIQLPIEILEFATDQTRMDQRRLVASAARLPGAWAQAAAGHDGNLEIRPPLSGQVFAATKRAI